MLRARSATTPHRPALIEGRSGRFLTWGQLHETALSWDARRDALASQPESRVGLAITDPLAAAAAFLGALGAGVLIAPLDGAAPPAQLLHQADDLALSALVTDNTDNTDNTDAALADSASASGLDVWMATGSDLALGQPRRGAGRPRARGRAAVIMATSGTTGRPKIVPLTERQLVSVAQAVAAHHGISDDDRGYCPLPLFHINALVVGVLSTLVADSTLVVDRRFSRRSFWATVAQHGVTWLNLVPPIIGVLATSVPPPPEAAWHIRFARSAAAPLPAGTAALFEQRCGVPVLETYGMTEAGSQITANPRGRAERRHGSVGLPVGVELRVVGDTGTPAPTSVIGHVEIRGATVVTEYWSVGGGEAPTQTARNADGWLATGDLGRLDADGFLYLAARADDVINRGGEKIYPREIEEVLLLDERVRGAVVVARPDDIAGAVPVAFVTAAVTHRRRASLVEDLRHRCASALSRFKLPAEIRVVDILPSGPTGKVRRQDVLGLLTSAAT
jgi:acyl-CoA synthetase (AMP-forming)/AMP-acid ligase II